MRPEILAKQIKDKLDQGVDKHRLRRGLCRMNAYFTQEFISTKVERLATEIKSRANRFNVHQYFTGRGAAQNEAWRKANIVRPFEEVAEHACSIFDPFDQRAAKGV